MSACIVASTNIAHFYSSLTNIPVLSFRSVISHPFCLLNFDRIIFANLLGLDLINHAKISELKELLSEKVVLGIGDGFIFLASLGFFGDDAISFKKGQENEFWSMVRIELCSANTWFNAGEKMFCKIIHPYSEISINENAFEGEIFLSYINYDLLNPYFFTPSSKVCGVCNHNGNILGMMPDPFSYVFSFQNPFWREYGKTVGEDGAGRVFINTFILK